MTWGLARLLQTGAFLAVGVLFLGSPGVTSPLPPIPALTLGTLLALGLPFYLAWHPRIHLGTLWAPALLAWSFFCSIGSLDYSRSELGLLSLGVATTVLLAFPVTIASKFDWRLSARLLLALALVSSLVGWSQIAQNGWELNARLSGNWTNSDCFSIVPLTAVFLSGTQMGRGGREQTFFTVLALFFLSTLLATWSRSSWLGLAVGLVTVLVRAIQGQSARVKQALYFLLCVTLPLIVFLLISGRWWHLHQRVQRTWSNPYDIPIRLELLATSLSTASHRPLLGSGPGTFALAYQEYRPLETPTADFVNVAHNDSLQVLVECGLPGLGLWLCLLAAAWRHARRAGEGWRNEGAWMQGALTALFVYSLFNFALPVPAALVWWYALLGLAFALPASGERELSERACLKFAVTIAVMGTFLFMTGLRGTLAQRASLQARALAATGQPQQALKAVSRSIALQPHHASLRLQRAEIVQALSEPGDFPAQVRQDLEAALYYSPRERAVWKALVEYAGSAGDGQLAHRVARLAYGYAPYERRFRRLYAGLEARAGHLENAAKVLLETPNEPPASVAPILCAMLYRPQEFTACMATLSFERRDAVSKAVLSLALESKDTAMIDRFFAWASEQPQLDRVKTKYEWSQALEQLGEGERALSILEDLLSSTGAEHDLYPAVLADWSRYTGKGSIPRLRAYLDSAPESSMVRAALADQLSSRAALELVSEGLALSPHDALLQEKMGDVLIRDRLFELAHDYYREALECGGDRGRLNEKLGHSH